MDSLRFIDGPAAPADKAARMAKMGFTGPAGQIKRLTDDRWPRDALCGLAGETDPWIGAKACQKARGLKQVTVKILRL